MQRIEPKIALLRRGEVTCLCSSLRRAMPDFDSALLLGDNDPALELRVLLSYAETNASELPGNRVSSIISSLKNNTPSDLDSRGFGGRRMIEPNPSYRRLDHTSNRPLLYPQESDERILHDLLNEQIHDDTLNHAASWERICQVRGRNRSAVSEEIWSRLCARRGVRNERNPDGL